MTRSIALILANDRAGMNGNVFFTFGIGKWPSLLPNFGIGNGNTKSNFQLLGLEMGMKNLIPTFGIGNGNEN